jgi:RND superfamily putative drug exporter
VTAGSGDGESEAVVEDLGSTNGTFVNGRRIDRPTAVGPDDVVMIGSAAIVLEEPIPAAVVVDPDDAERGLLHRLTNASTSRPRRVLAVVGALFVVAVPFGAPVVGKLHDHYGFIDPGSETARARDLLNRATDSQPNGLLVALVSTGADPSSGAARAKVARVASLIAAQSRGTIRSVQTYYETHSPALLSADRRSQLVSVIFRDIPQRRTEDASTRVKDALAHETGVLVGGSSLAGPAIGKQVGMDLGKAEGIAFPILFIASLLVFRGVVAALLPLFVGAITIMLTFLLLRLVNIAQPLSPFAVNLVTGLGLGLAIDYSLLLVWRYREELARASSGDLPSREQFVRDAPQALRRTLQTGGRTILFSSLTVAAATASLIVFRQPFLYSMGLGGAFTALIAVTVALIALPALLTLLGPRVNALAPARWQRAAQRSARAERSGFWYRQSRWVMRRPAAVAVVAAAVLIALGVPALGLKFTGADASVLPKSSPARQVADARLRDFPLLHSDPERVAVLAPASAGGAVDRYARQLAARPDVAQVGRPRALGTRLWEVDVTPRQANLDGRSLDLVRSIRTQAPFAVEVTGPTAEFLDERHSITTHLPLALGLLVAATVIVLFLMTGSVVLPLKSLLMNLLSLSAAMGLLVLIFQDGHLQGVLGFHSPGALDLSQPVLLAALAFGLSTDYATFLLTRIKEARDHGEGDTEAVAIGLERTGRIVTQAALLFCIAVGAFATSQIIFIKEVGVGTALAVLIDASIVRAFLVPSLMALLGRRNWWAPPPLRRLHARLGLREG